MEPERCAECGFDGSRLTIGDAVASLRSMDRRWHDAFADTPDDRLRRRPAPEVWSPLEYAAHTRDVLRLHHMGIGMILEGTHPAFPSIPPDPPGADHGYNAQDPRTMLDELATAAGDLADLAGPARPEMWDRTGEIGGVEHDAGWLLRHAVHDASHHLFDIEKDLGA